MALCRHNFPSLIYWMQWAHLFFTRHSQDGLAKRFPGLVSGRFSEECSRPTVPRELAVAALSFGSHSSPTPSVKGVQLKTRIMNELQPVMSKALAMRSDIASLKGGWFGTRFELRPTSFLAAPGCGPFIYLSVLVLFCMAYKLHFCDRPLLVLFNGLGLQLLALTLVFASGPLNAVASEPTETTVQERSSLVVTTSNFIVRSYDGGPNAAEVAEVCKALRPRIQIKWFGKASAESWQPVCEIVLHATKGSYLHAVGPGAGQTSGSSLIEQQSGRVVSRRIDMLVDQRGRTTALPHELTHVVLADFFPGQRPPAWFDEGVATLADPEEKLARHRRDCCHAVHSGTAFPLTKLLTLDRLSSAEQFPAFYGQSVSLVRFLAEQDEPTKILRFAKLGIETGYGQALRTSYGIESVGQLQRLWLDHVLSLQGRQGNRAAVVGRTR